MKKINKNLKVIDNSVSIPELMFAIDIISRRI
jgi:hypothetical protein